MLHTKSQGHRPSGSGEVDFLRVFTIYGRGGHLGSVTKIIWTNFRSPILRSLHMKYEFNWPSSFRGEDVWKCWRTTDDGRTDGRRSHWYTISSPMSLWLRWAKNRTGNSLFFLTTWRALDASRQRWACASNTVDFTVVSCADPGIFVMGGGGGGGGGGVGGSRLNWQRKNTLITFS